MFPQTNIANLPIFFVSSFIQLSQTKKRPEVIDGR
jgi:hypothetical protein